MSNVVDAPSDSSEAPRGRLFCDWEPVHARLLSYSEEIQRIIATQSVERSCRILDLACGTGRHLIEAAKLGHRCTGIEQQEWKLAKAKKERSALGLEIEFLCSDIRNVKVDPIYDLVTCLYAMSTMITNADVAAAFRTARRALRPTGKFVFNVINREANGDLKSPTYALVHKTGHLRDFMMDEIRTHLHQTGFELERIETFGVSGIENLDIFVVARPRSVA